MGHTAKLIKNTARANSHAHHFLKCLYTNNAQKKQALNLPSEQLVMKGPHLNRAFICDYLSERV